MSSKAETLKAAALEKGDHSQLCTKNIDGQMFLMLASEIESSDSEDSDTDSCNSANGNSDSLDSDAEISVSLLDENGLEMEEIVIGDVPRSSMISIPNLLKNLPAFPEVIPKPINKISSFTLPTTAASTAGGTLMDRVKILPMTNSSPSALSSTPHNTYIIKTTMPLSSLDLKSLIYSTGSLSRLAPKPQSENITKIPETIVYPKKFISDHTYVSTNRRSQACSFSSSTTPINRVSQEPITATTNFITAPISSVNHINSSLTDKPVLQNPSSLLNNNNNVIRVHVNPNSKLLQPLPNQVATSTHQLVSSFPTSLANVIKPITPLLDTGQQVPKVQTANTTLVGTYLTSVTSSDVQSNSLPSDQSAQLFSLSSTDNSNSHMTPCLLISNTPTNTSSTQSVMTKPIVHTGFVPQNLVSNIINPGPGQTTLINNAASTITNSITTPVLAPKDKIAIVPNTLQPAATLTSSMCTSVAGVTNTNSNSFSTTTISSTSLLPMCKSVAGANKTDSSGHFAPLIINSSSLLPTCICSSSSTSNTVLAISQPNSSDGPLLVKIIPKSNPGPTDLIPPLTTFGSLNSMAQAQNNVCKTTSSISGQVPNPSETKNTKDNLKETQVSHNMTINGSSLSAAMAADSATNPVGSKTAVSVNNPVKGNNVKSIWLLTPSEASTLFSSNKTTPLPASLTSLSNSLNQDANSAVQKNAALTKVQQSSGSQPSPLMILKEEPAVPKSSVVTPAMKSSDSSENINPDSLMNDPEVNSKADQEQNKVDDTVQFLKLGSFANNIKLEPGVIKVEPVEYDSDKTEDRSVLEAQSNLTDVLNKANNPFFLDDTNETYKASLKIPTCLANNTDTTDNSAVLKVPVGLIHIPEKTDKPSDLKVPTSLVKVKTENPTVFKIPNNLVSDTNKTENESILKIPNSLVIDMNKTGNNSASEIATSLEDNSVLDPLVSLNGKYSSKIVVNVNQSPSVPFVKPPANNNAVIKVPASVINRPVDVNKADNDSASEISTSPEDDSDSDPLESYCNKYSSKIVVSVNQKTCVQVVKPPANNNAVIKVPTSVINRPVDVNKVDNNSASEIPTSPEDDTDSDPPQSFRNKYSSPIVVVKPPANNNAVIKVPTSVINRNVLTLPPGTRISSSAPVGTNLVSSNSGFLTFTNKAGSGQQVLSLTSQALTGSQVVSLNSQAPTPTVYVAMPGQGGSGTKLVSLPNQVPAGSRLVAVPNQSGTGTKLVALPIQTQTNTQLVTIPSQVPSGSQLVGLTSQVGGPTKLLAVPKHAAGMSVTRFAAITSQAASGPQVVSVNNQAATGAQLVNLNNQSFVGQPRVSLINRGTSGQQFVPLMNQNVSPQIIRLASQIQPGMKLPVQNLSGNPVVKMGYQPSNVKLLPLNNAAILQLSQMAKTSPQLVSTSMSSNIQSQMVTANSTNKPNSNSTVPNFDSSDLLRQLQNGEKCAVVVKQKKGVTSPTTTSTMTTNKVVSMQSLLRPKILLKNKIASKSSSVPVSLPEPPQQSTETVPEPVEDLPMTLKIDSIFSLKDGENKAVDYWETSSSPSSSNKVNNLVETGCSTPVKLPSQGNSPPKYEKVSPNTKPVQIQQKVVLSNDIQSEKEKTDTKTPSSPQPKPIVYARLNKPKPPITPVQMKHYKLHDLSNHFPLSQRKRFMEISRTFKPEMMKSCVKNAKKARVFPIKGRIHYKEVQKKKYNFLQPRVMLAQVYIPARMKSIRIKQMPAETVKSLKCQENCVDRVRVSYPKGKRAAPTSNQNFMLVRVEGKNIIPYYTGAGTKPNVVLKDNSNVPVPLSSASAAQNWLLKQGITGAANIFTVPSSTFAKLGVGSFRNILPANIERKDNVMSQPSPNKDDALSLACGIIQDNTLKRKSPLSLDYDWRGLDPSDSDWSLDLERQHLSHKKKR